METGWGESTLFAKLCFLFVIIGFLLHMIGFYSISWSVWSFIHPPPNDIMITMYEGLWETCQASYFRQRCWGFKSESWLEAVQAFETLGFIAGLAALVLIILYIFVPATSGRKIVFILCMLACFIAAGCIILGIIIYGSKMSNLSWSFALCTIAGIIFGISGVLLLVDTFKR